MTTKPITQRAKSSPFKAMPIPPELVKTLASSVIADIGSGKEKVIKEEEDKEPTKKAVAEEPAKKAVAEEPAKRVVTETEGRPKTFAQSLVSGIESGRRR